MTFSLNPSTGKKFYCVDVVNSGGQPITIESVGIKFENKMYSPFSLYPDSERIGPILPLRLLSHASQSWHFGEESTKMAFIDLKVAPRFKAYIQLATGKVKNSKTMKVQIFS